MTPEEAKNYISDLTYRKKMALNELLGQKRSPVSSHLESDSKVV